MNYRSNSNANSNSNENENEALPPPVIVRGGNSNSNSNANENEMNKRRKQAVEVLRQKLNKLEFKPSGALKPYTIQNKVVKVRGVNVNTMSKVQLQNAARNIAKVIAPGQTIDFNKNIPQLVRFVKAGAKKILSKK
jgi:ribosomal protein S18